MMRLGVDPVAHNIGECMQVSAWKLEKIYYRVNVFITHNRLPTTQSRDTEGSDHAIMNMEKELSEISGLDYKTVH